jgi:hypothetical protein
MQHDVIRELSVEDWGRQFVRHFGSLYRYRPISYRANRDDDLGSPLSITPLPLPPSDSSRPNSPRLSSVESTWEVESEIYGDEFSVCMERG